MADTRQASAAPAVDQALPAVEMALPAWRLVAYQGATWDFHRGHHDWEYARAVGEQAPYADGQLFGALMTRLVTSWAGRDAFVRSLGFRLRDMVRPGESVRVSGTVTEVDEHESDWLAKVNLRVEVPAPEGGEARTVAVGEAVVEIPRPGSPPAGSGRRVP